MLHAIKRLALPLAAAEFASEDLLLSKPHNAKFHVSVQDELRVLEVVRDSLHQLDPRSAKPQDIVKLGESALRLGSKVLRDTEPGRGGAATPSLEFAKTPKHARTERSTAAAEHGTHGVSDAALNALNKVGKANLFRLNKASSRQRTDGSAKEAVHHHHHADGRPLPWEPKSNSSKEEAPDASQPRVAEAEPAPSAASDGASRRASETSQAPVAAPGDSAVMVDWDQNLIVVPSAGGSAAAAQTTMVAKAEPSDFGHLVPKALETAMPTILDAAAPEQRAANRSLVLKHVPKTGGSFIYTLLKNMTTGLVNEGNDSLLKYIDVVGPLARESPSDFIISSMRNPCDWYVSAWASFAQRDRDFLHSKFGTDSEPEPFFESENMNMSKFKNFVRWTQGAWAGSDPAPSDNSLFSLLLWESLSQGKSLAGYTGRTLDAHVRSLASRPEVERGLSAFSPGTAVDCWISTEAFVEDLKYCLDQYQQRSGAQLDWRAFTERFDGTHFQFHRQTHTGCSDYYDPDLAASVMQHDRHVFSAFGYEQCCGPPSNRIK